MFKTLLTLSTICLILLSGQAAQAGDKMIQGNAGPDDIQAAHNFLPIAQKFGMNNIAFANVDANHTQMIVEYLADGQTLDSWTRMFTVTIVPTGEDNKQANSATAATISSMQDLIKKSGADVKSFDIVDRDPKGPAAFMHYTLKGEENAGVISRSSPTFMTVMQVQSRGKALSETDLANAKALLN